MTANKLVEWSRAMNISTRQPYHYKIYCLELRIIRVTVFLPFLVLFVLEIGEKLGLSSHYNFIHASAIITHFDYAFVLFSSNINKATSRLESRIIFVLIPPNHNCREIKKLTLHKEPAQFPNLPRSVNGWQSILGLFAVLRCFSCAHRKPNVMPWVQKWGRWPELTISPKTLLGNVLWNSTVCEKLLLTMRN